MKSTLYLGSKRGVTAFILLCLSLLPLSLYASWSTTPDSAVFVGSVYYSRALVPDSYGGAYTILWYGRSWVQRFNQDGIPCWDEWVELSANGAHEQWYINSTKSTDNCLIVLYLDVQFTAVPELGRGEFHIQKIDSSGTKLWGDQGIIFTNSDLSGQNNIDQIYGLQARLIPSDYGGCFVVWTDYRDVTGWGYHPDLYCQKFSSDGEIEWQEYGIFIDSDVENIWTMHRDQFSGFDVIYGPPIKLQKVDESGLLIHGAGGIQSQVATANINWFTFNPNGEIFFVDGQHNIYKTDNEFLPIWPINGIHLNYNTGYYKGIKADSQGGACLYMEDTRNGTPGLYFQSIDSDGNFLSGDSGAWVFPGLGTYTTFTKCGDNSFFLTQQVNHQQYVDRVDFNGVSVWGGNVLLCTKGTNYPPGKPLAVTDGAGGLIYLFDDGTNMWLSKVDAAGNLGSYVTVAPEVNKPESFHLSAFPNPFNPTTTIRYTLPENGRVTVTIYDQLGRRVNQLVSAKQNAGEYTAQWNGRDDTGRQLASGLYFCQVSGGGFSKSIKLVLLK